MSEIIVTDPQYLEQVFALALLQDKGFIVSVSHVYEGEFFDSPHLQVIFDFVTAHFNQYKEIPSREILMNSIPADTRDGVANFLSHVDAMDFDLSRNYDWLMGQSDAYLRDKAIKRAVRNSIDIINAQGNTYDIRMQVEDALCKTIYTDIGIKYFEDIGQRLYRMCTDDTQRIPTYFPRFDEYINGGFPPKTLSVFVAKVHGFKSNIMANMIARQVLNGKNVALASLEMSEDMFAQRFDGIYSQQDINRFYFNTDQIRLLKERLSAVKATEGRGELYIKSFPTGKASVKDFRIWLRELKMRGVDIDIFYFDYLNLMASEEIKKGGDSYTEVKSIAEETRAMGFEFDIPMISVSQLNRSGTFMTFEDVDFNSIAESMGVPATADFMMIMGRNDDHMVYENEVHYKIVKNRLGGRIGEIDKFYYDARSMKMYCSCTAEQEQWLEDVRISNDDRNRFQHQQDE